MGVALTIAAIVGVIAVLIAVAVVMERKRTASIGEMASQLGLEFYKDGRSDLQARLNKLGLFSQGHSRKLSNLLHGATEEVSISIFDYHYTTGSGKQSQTHRMTIAALESGKLSNPAFSLRPENFFDKIGGLLGFQDIDFEDHEAFSRMFVLKGPDIDAIRRFFSRELLDFFVSKPGICVEAHPGIMIYYRPGRRIKAEEYKDLLAQAYQIYGTIVDRERMVEG